MENFYSKYKILTKIGEGIHSSVYKCLHIKTEKLFAVKISKNVDE
jgi:serine/threonine protein kinase